MRLEDYFTRQAESVLVSRKQASTFAKQIAGDFNPIHDEDAKRFCVPGDLLFALGLHHYGLCQHMCFNFGGMVSENVPLRFPATDAGEISICDLNGKEYLNIVRSGKCTKDSTLINNLTQRYVEFSGQTFPHILVPLMAAQGVMINTERPLVIYERMLIHVENLDTRDPVLELSDTRLDVDGKRGNVSVQFVLKDNDAVVGKGEKNIVLSGLRDFDQSKIDLLVTDYNARKLNYSVPVSV